MPLAFLPIMGSSLRRFASTDSEDFSLPSYSFPGENCFALGLLEHDLLGFGFGMSSLVDY